MKTKLKGRLLTLLLVLTLVLGSTITAYAAVYDTSGSSPLKELKLIVISGKYTYVTGSKTLDMTTNKYSIKGGGTIYYYELMTSSSTSGGFVADGESDDFFDTEKFDSLKQSAKKNFLGDVFTICNAVATDTANGYNTGANAPSDDTVQEFMNVIQNQTGMGSQLLATLLQNTKPDYVAANRIYEPFSGVVGTILGVLSVIVMALLGITMALDIVFITIPAVQLMMGADGSGQGGQDSANKMSRLISAEARQAVQAQGDSGGGGGQSGDGKLALGIYFKKRWKSLVLLGICLLYLVQGQIYSLVAWIIDLLSGFLDF